MNFDSNGNKIPKISKVDAHIKITKAKAEVISEGRKCSRCHIPVIVRFDEDYGENIIECPRCKLSKPVFI